MSNLKAIIFDVDGTLADTERLGHRVAFNQAFADAGLDWNWNEELYGELLTVTGGKERIKFFINKYLDDFKLANPDKYIADIHASKTRHYVELVNSGKLPLRQGAASLIKSALKNDIKVAIATTTTWENVETLLKSQLGAGSLDWFSVIAAGDIVEHKKPAPDIYLYALNKLGLEAENCIALEDSRNGLLSSIGAGLKTVVTTNGYTKNENLSEAELVVNKIGTEAKPFKIASGYNYGQSYVNLTLRPLHNSPSKYGQMLKLPAS